MDVNRLGIANAPYSEVLRICDQLAEKLLIEFTAAKGRGGVTMHGAGKIYGLGVDVIERQAPPASRSTSTSHPRRGARLIERSGRQR